MITPSAHANDFDAPQSKPTIATPILPPVSGAPHSNLLQQVLAQAPK